jgi:hypothetical protein
VRGYLLPDRGPHKRLTFGGAVDKSCGLLICGRVPARAFGVPVGRSVSTILAIHTRREIDLFTDERTNSAGTRTIPLGSFNDMTPKKEYSLVSSFSTRH